MSFGTVSFFGGGGLSSRRTFWSGRTIGAAAAAAGR
jgi:hypothetical protein